MPASALILAPILARGLGPGDRGIFSNDQALVLVASSILSLGVADASSVFWEKWSRRRRAMLYWTNAGVAAAFGVLAAGLANAQRLLDPIESGLLVVGALAFAIGNHLRGVSLASGSVLAVGIEKWITSATRLISTVILFAVDNLTIVTALASLVIPQAVGAAYLAVSSRGIPSESSTEATSGVLWAVLGGAAGVLLVNLDQIVLLPLIGATQLGYYAIAVTLSELFTTAARPFRDAAMSWRGIPPMTIAVRAGALLIAGAVGAALAYGWVVPWLFGEDYADAVPACLSLIAGGVLKAWGYVLAAYLVKSHRHRSRLLLTLAGVIIDLALLVPLAGFGAVGAAVAASVGYGVLALGALPIALRAQPVQPAVVASRAGA